MNREQHKQTAAAAAVDMIRDGCALGVGSGSTVNYFIALLPPVKNKIAAVVSSSEATTKRLELAGLSVHHSLSELDVYVDGADEADDNFQLIKGGGGALTREKVVANMAKKFVCIIDGGKKVKRLGKFPLAVEVLPMARSFVARKLAAMGANVKWREGFVTDNGNWILDAANLDIINAARLEMEICAVAGVLDCGIFARRPADILLVADARGVCKLQRQ